jgi:UDP-N-acetylmuramate--alanine ligase
MKIHFIGIGGIGMSALARHYISLGHSVSGSDQSSSEIITDLIDEGANIKIGHSRDNITPDINMVVYTAAIDNSNPELVRARELVNMDASIKVLTYAEALGEMTKSKRTIAICGTHGKTTTTAMAYEALKSAGVDASMILGSLIDYKGKKTNYIGGTSDWIIIEACEYKRSFLNYNPEIIIVTNIDSDHLDYYKDLKEIQEAFQQFVNRLPDNGELIVHKNEFDILNFKNKILADDYSKNDLNLSVPGEHNRNNAQLIVALGNVLKLNSEKIGEGLRNFKGTWRRQEYMGRYFNMECYDDYAHHPSEIKATLQAFKELVKNNEVESGAGEKKVVAAFMPHLYSRTKLLLNEFAESFSDADEVILLPIYAAREVQDTSISSEMLAEKIKGKGKAVKLVKDINEFKDYMQSRNNEGFVLVTMGAGDIYKVYK